MTLGRGVKIDFRRALPSRNVHAASFMRERRVLLDRGLLDHAPEAMRILAHELFHFVWIRLDNGSRKSWRTLVDGELEAGVQGELGWSAELRKEKIVRNGKGPRLWPDYVCESFCDTAAWYFTRSVKHEEFTLDTRARTLRAKWFAALISSKRLPV